jgi:hypothetical protein
VTWQSSGAPTSVKADKLPVPIRSRSGDSVLDGDVECFPEQLVLLVAPRPTTRNELTAVTQTPPSEPRDRGGQRPSPDLTVGRWSTAGPAPR